MEYFTSHLLNSSFFTGLGCGICLSLAFMLSKGFQCKDVNIKSAESTEESPAGDGDIKLVLVVRTDLKMGKGKAAAQCSHAAVSAFKTAKVKKPNTLAEWEENGQPKIVVKCDSEEELIELSRAAKKLNLITSVICDAGRTQIAAGSRTVLGVGPGPVDLINEVTGHLKLY